MNITDFTERLERLKRLPSDRVKRAQNISEQLSDEDRQEFIAKLEHLDGEFLKVLHQEQEYLNQLEALNTSMENSIRKMGREGEEFSERQQEEQSVETMFDNV